jgi:hypothetical protein
MILLQYCMVEVRRPIMPLSVEGALFGSFFREDPISMQRRLNLSRKGDPYLELGDTGSELHP